MSKGLRKASLWGVVVLAVFIGGKASGGIFTYEPIMDPIESASFSVDFAAFVGHRTVLGYEMNYVKLIDSTGASDPLDLSDEFFGTATWPDEPKMNMGPLETGIVSAEIDQSFFPALAGGKIEVAFRFTDTDDAMFAMDFMGLTIETTSKTITSYYGWPVGNENDGFGIGLADGADLPAPLPVSIPVRVTRTGFNETIASKTEIPEPATLTLLGFGAAWLLGRRSGRGRMKGTVVVVLLATAFLVQGASAITITNVNIYQMDFGELTGTPITDSNCGDFEFTVVPDDDSNEYYLNLWIRQDGNSPAYRVIENMLLPGSIDINAPSTSVRMFSLADIVESGMAVGQLEYQIKLSEQPFGSDPPPGTFTETEVLSKSYNVGAGLTGLEDLGQGGGSQPPVGGPVGGEIRNKVVVTRDDNDLPDVGEDVNECVPASVARSLLWMHKKKFIDLGVKADPNILKKDFKDACRWYDHNDTPGLKGLLTGKFRVTKDINVINKCVGPEKCNDCNFRDFNTPDGKVDYRGKVVSWEFIRNEIDANEDVEIMLVELDPNGVPTKKGHTVTVIGHASCSLSKMLRIQQDPNQNDSNSLNERRWVVWDNNTIGLFNKRYIVGAIVSESPKPEEIDQIELYRPDDLYSPDVAVGTSAGITAAVQYNFAGVPGVDVEFIKRYGSFRFTSGFIVNDGQKSVATTNGNGLATIDIVGETPGPAIIEATVTGAEQFVTYLFFDVIPCPISQDRDNDCDVDFRDYAIFANDWLNGEDWSQLRLLCEQWLEGK
jgi:hypothetical protein